MEFVFKKFIRYSTVLFSDSKIITLEGVPRKQKMLNSLTAIAVINFDINKLILILEILVICNAKFATISLRVCRKALVQYKYIPGKYEV
jgi:hypothetical protein